MNLNFYFQRCITLSLHNCQSQTRLRHFKRPVFCLRSSRLSKLVNVTVNHLHFAIRRCFKGVCLFSVLHRLLDNSMNLALFCWLSVGGVSAAIML